MLPSVSTNSYIHLWSKHGFKCRVVSDFFECWIKMHTGLNIFLKKTNKENIISAVIKRPGIRTAKINTFDSTVFPQNQLYCNSRQVRAFVTVCRAFLVYLHGDLGR